MKNLKFQKWSGLLHAPMGGWTFNWQAEAQHMAPVSAIRGHVDGRGDFIYNDVPEVVELAEFCKEMFGPEWKRWHLKVILNDMKVYSTAGVGDFGKLRVEVFFQEDADFALFKLRFAGE